MVTEPSLIEQVLVANQDAFTIGQQQRETFSGIEDDAVTANTGDHWKRLRKVFTRRSPGTASKDTAPGWPNAPPITSIAGKQATGSIC